MKPKHLDFETESATYGKWQWERPRSVQRQSVCGYLKALLQSKTTPGCLWFIPSFFHLFLSIILFQQRWHRGKQRVERVADSIDYWSCRHLQSRVIPPVCHLHTVMNLHLYCTHMAAAATCVSRQCWDFNLSPGTLGSNVDCMNFHVRVGHGWLWLMSFLWTQTWNCHLVIGVFQAKSYFLPYNVGLSLLFKATLINILKLFVFSRLINPLCTLCSAPDSRPATCR